MKELLDSDRVNYLVWRFLLESNYRETAAKLQKEWHVEAPHRQFDFAPHVKNYALVSVLNKGLVYEDLERQYAESKAPRDVPATTEAKPTGVFGPLIPEPAPSEEDDDGEDSEPEEVENSRKRPVDSQHAPQSNGSSVKRQRLSNGYDAAESAADPMELDNPAENNHAYPSPLEAEQAESPIPRTDGPEQGTQVDKVHELSQETTFLRLTTAGQFAATSPMRANDNPIVLHCEWNPRDPAILAAAGTDALARIWTVPRAAAPEDTSGHVEGVQRPYHNLVEDDVPQSAGVSAMAWNWDGTAIAIAWEISNKARISIWSADGAHIHRYDGVEPPVIKLRWSPNNALVLGIAPENGGTLVTVFSATSATSMSYSLERHNLHEEPLDATWTSETEFVLCGGDLLLALRCTDDGIVASRKFETHSDEGFFQVQFDWRSKLLATSSEKGAIDIWDESGQRNTIHAHQDTITCLQWQPLQSNPPDDERLIASGGEDGALCIWNARDAPEQPKYFMSMKEPVVALAFTPDGAFIAGATAHRILIWKVGDAQIPRASWSRMPHPGWLSPRVNGEQEEEDQHCLGWDVTGQRLAYATNSRLAVINFR